MTIFIEIVTEIGVQSINVDDIRRIREEEPDKNGYAQCRVITCEHSWKVRGKSYAAIMALLRAAGATIITGSHIPRLPENLLYAIDELLRQLEGQEFDRQTEGYINEVKRLLKFSKEV